MKFLLLSLLASSALLTMAMEDTKDLFDIEAILQHENIGELEDFNFEFKPEPSAEKEKRARSPQVEFDTVDQSKVVQQKMPRVDNSSQPISSLPKSQMIPGITCLACVDKLEKSSTEKAAQIKQIEEYLNTQRPSYIAHMYKFVSRRMVPICGFKK